MKKLDKDTVLVTVDGGKTSHWAYISCENGNKVETFEFLNRRSGFNRVYKMIKDFMKKEKMKRFAVGYESTGSYLRPLVSFFESKGARLIQVNPKHTKRVKEIVDNSPNKTDKKDPIVIAQIIRLGNGLNTLLPTGSYSDLRNLCHERERCMKDRTRNIGRLEALLAECFPEFLMVMKTVTTKTSIYLLKKYTTPTKLAKLSLSKLTAILREKSRYQLGEDRAIDLLEAAKETVGITEGIATMEDRLKLQIEQLEITTKQIRQIEKKITTICQSIPCSKYIMSIKGVGCITTAYILGEVTDLSKFEKASNIIKLAGLNLYELSSGEFKGNRRITKIGRGLLRKVLYFAAMRTVKKGGPFHDYYQKCVDRGKKKKSSLVVVMKKLLRLIFALTKQERFYQSDYQKTLSEQLIAA